MTEQQQIRHLLRRFGLGASLSEVARYEKIGINRAIDDILDFDKPDTGCPISPWEFVFQEDGRVLLDPPRMAAWWAMRMLLTDRPSYERLTLFWHDHFAVSAGKVQSGLLMLNYLKTLRKNAAGDFRTLLDAVTKDPAMMRWLDADTNIRGKPNENYARELLELFTIGIGNYTERDVQETARALTGWSLRNIYKQGDQESTKAQVLKAAKDGPPLVTPTFSPRVHDNGTKTILGVTDRFDTEKTLDLLVDHPQTAQYVTTKLWEFYAYPNPEEQVRERLARSYFDSNRDIRAVLHTITQSEEFWSEKCLRTLVKSPVDFIIAFLRQLERSESILEQRGKDATETTPATAYIIGVGNALLTLMDRQGMRLLYPPDVAGWDWGEGWISTTNMLERVRFADLLLGPARGIGTVESIRRSLRDSGQPINTETAVKVIAEKFDAEPTREQQKLLVDAMDAAGGIDAVVQEGTTDTSLLPVVKLIFAMPEYQLF